MPEALLLLHARKTGMTIRHIASVSISLLFPVLVLAQSSKPEQPMVVLPLAAARMSVSVPLIADPLRLSDFAGMAPRAALRDKLGHVDDFIQQNPHDGKPATEKTEVWMATPRRPLFCLHLFRSPAGADSRAPGAAGEHPEGR